MTAHYHKRSIGCSMERPPTKWIPCPLCPQAGAGPGAQGTCQPPTPPKSLHPQPLTAILLPTAGKQFPMSYSPLFSRQMRGQNRMGARM